MLSQQMPSHILIVEDDPVSRSLLELYVEQEGYCYVSAQNGREALELFNNQRFSIVITDWLMPEVDGTELCRAIRSQSRDYYTCIILLTSKCSPEELIEGLEAGADDYVIKPINPGELRVRLKGCRRILDLENSLRESLAEIRLLSIHDPLTGAFNRGYLDQQLAHEIQRACRYQHPLSLILCDLDYFKLINDTYGHQTGDDVLKVCVQNISDSIRHNIDWVARYGGEEFIIALPETDHIGCRVVAERMRERMATTPCRTASETISITASFGTATFSPALKTTPTTSEELIRLADTHLYQAKQAGRNRVVSENQDIR
jgi:diguanylate cyclase (GGDEF)-like protein